MNYTKTLNNRQIKLLKCSKSYFEKQKIGINRKLLIKNKLYIVS